MSSHGQPSAMEQVIETFDQLTEWGTRVQSGFAPAAGSALADDEAVFRWHSTAQVAWEGLSAAQDHLKGFRAWLLHPEPELFPMATFSLLRGALVGGAIAAWVLLPDEVDARVGRSLSVAAEWYENHLFYGKTVEPIAMDAAAHAEQLRHLEGRAKEVKALRSGREPKHFTTTKAILEANAELWPGDTGRAIVTRALWQAGSGDAHALGWAVLTRRYEKTPLGDGMAEFAARPTDRDVADAFLCAYDFVAYGFHRIAELGNG